MGDFQCLDKQGNLILGNAHETVTTATGASENKHMGMVLIPKEQQVKVEVQVIACALLASASHAAHADAHGICC